MLSRPSLCSRSTLICILVSTIFALSVAFFTSFARSNSRQTIPTALNGVLTLPPDVARGVRPLSLEASNLLARTNTLLNRLRNDARPLDQGNWARAHWALVFGQDGYQSKDRFTNYSMLLRSFLHIDSSNLKSAFSLRHGRLVGCETGSRQDRQGHTDQFLAYLSLSGVPLDAQFGGAADKLFFRDLLDESMRQAHPENELSWSLLAYAQYLNPHLVWRNKFGENTSVISLTASALHHHDTSCGGSHQDHAFAQVLSILPNSHDLSIQSLRNDLVKRINARISFVRSSSPLLGGFDVSDTPPQSLHSDQKFSCTAYFLGHTIEWLSLAITQEDLTSHWVLQRISLLIDAITDEVDSISTADQPETTACKWADIGHAAAGLSRWAFRVETRANQNLRLFDHSRP